MNLYAYGRDKNRDLSASAKYKIPFIPEDWFSVAIGARDIGGAVNQFSAYYGVISKEWWQFRINAGMSNSQSGLGQMNGPIGGVEWQPVDWLQLLAEYDGSSRNIGLRLYNPAAWLPAGWQVSSSLLAKQSEARAEKDYWWGVALKIPLAVGVAGARYDKSGFITDAEANSTGVSPNGARTSTVPVATASNLNTGSKSLGDDNHHPAIIQSDSTPDKKIDSKIERNDVELHLYQRLMDRNNFV